MDVTHKRELLQEKNSTDKDIHFTHVNIRKSISLLLIRLIVLECLAAVIVVALYFVMVNIQQFQESAVTFTPIYLGIFLFFVLLKIFLTGYIIHEWHEEYYEISAKTVGHKKGHIFRRHEAVKLEHIASIKLEQGLLGRIFNYGTIRLHSWFLGKDYFLYQIHNPKKYAKLLEDLTPRADQMEKVVREHIIEEDTD